MTGYLKPLLMVFWLLAFSVSEAAQIKAVRMANIGPQTRLVIELSAPFRYRAFTLNYPDRLVIDFNHTQLGKKFVLGKNPFFQRMRSSKHGTSLRMVFDLKQHVYCHHYTLPANQTHPHRLVIDFSKQATRLKKSGPPPLPKPKIVNLKRQALRDVVIVIDPGHGGKDPGAIGVHGAVEKNIVLAIAKRLQRLINQQPGMTAKLTRHRDRYISLRQRLNLARHYSADIFIAIHADAYIHKRAHGASVFALSETGASSEAARWLAARENHSELGDVSLHDKSELLRSVLIDLSQTATNLSSIQLGKIIIDNLSNVTDLHSAKIEQAQFVVLKSPDIPSLLIETGFLSNPDEVKRLINPRYQQRLANAIVRGLKNYLRAHAPTTSWIAHQLNSRVYIVQKGDSLSQISSRYKVRATDVKRLNKLSTSRLYPGQKLRIPLAKEQKKR